MYVLGIDVGTTGTKTLLVDETGRVLGSGYKGYALQTDGCRVEQNANDWWDAVQYSVHKALEGQNSSAVKAIALSTQGATMFAADEQGEAIGNAITWMDTRAAEEAKALEKNPGNNYIYEATGWRVSPILDAAKIAHMKQSGRYSGAQKYLSTLEYINWKLAGRMVIDPTNASIRQLYNYTQKKWDDRILSAIGCGEQELPELLPAGALVGRLTAKAAKELGLGNDVRVYNGAHDQYCASIGSGAIHAGDMYISTGTTWAVMGIADQALHTKTFIASCPHPVAGLYGNMITLTSAGSSYQWAQDVFCTGDTFQTMDAESEKRIGKNENLYFIPWLFGANYPFWLPEAKGGFVGADLHTSQYDLALSVLESAAFLVKMAVEDFVENGCSVKNIRVMGGASKSKVWMGILKDVLEIPICKMERADTCALGAAMLALCAEGSFGSYDAAAMAMTNSTEISGLAAPEGYYQEKYQTYKKLLNHVAAFYSK